MKIDANRKLLYAFNLPTEQAIELLRELGVDTSGNWEQMMSDADKCGFIISRVLAADILQDMKDELAKALMS